MRELAAVATREIDPKHSTPPSPAHDSLSTLHLCSPTTTTLPHPPPPPTLSTLYHLLHFSLCQNGKRGTYLSIAARPASAPARHGPATAHDKRQQLANLPSSAKGTPARRIPRCHPIDSVTARRSSPGSANRLSAMMVSAGVVLLRLRPVANHGFLQRWSRI